MRTNFLSVAFPLLAMALASEPAAQAGQSDFGQARPRELAELGILPAARDVVVRDIVNYHRHQLPLPRADQAVALDLRFDRSSCRSGDTVVLQVGYTTQPQGDRTFAPPCSVALVVDCSGSMSERGKMDQVRAGLREFAARLRPDDEVALVAFSTEARVVVGLRPCRDGRWLQSAIEELQPDGNTNLHAGLMLGLRELAAAEDRTRAARVVLLTDGLANTGVTDPAQIVADATGFSRRSIDISTIGVGQNLDVPLLEKLARGTRGLFHFVADATDVQKVFVKELDSLLAPSARRPHLEVTLPRGLRIERVLHEGALVHEDGFGLDLPDLNAGATGVVVVRCRVDPYAAESLRADASLDFDTATTGRPTHAAAHAELSLRAEGRAQVDLEVQKNHAIAVLAQGLRDMALACEGKRWADADRCLRLARDEAQRLFPGDDQDLQRVRDIAAGHARTLQRYVDRFRDY